MSIEVLNPIDSCILWRELYIYELADRFKIDILDLTIKYYTENQHILLPNYGEYFLDAPTIIHHTIIKLSDRTDLILYDRFKQSVGRGDKYYKSIALFSEKEL